MSRIAPLSLLLNCSLDDGVERLSAVISFNGDVAIVHGKIGKSCPMLLLFQGITYSAKLVAFEGDLNTHRNIFCNIDKAKIMSVLTLDLGDNVKGGETIPPIVKGLLGLARRIGQAIDTVAVVWNPAHIVSGFSYFSESIDSYEKNGAFPALALVDFNMQMDGEISSKGLSWFSEQELIFFASHLSREEAMRRMVRVVHDIATNGPILSRIEIKGLDLTETMILTPSTDGEIVMMQSMSKTEH